MPVVEKINMSKILISACLIGQKVRYDAKDSLQSNARLQQWIHDGKIISICPEMAGGLPTPRPPSEIEPGKTAEAILQFHGKVLTNKGVDVSDEYRKGAETALKLAKKHNIKVAILKARSPSCGSKQVYDGTCSKKLIEGMGITAHLLTKNGIRVFDETEIDEALDSVEKNKSPNFLSHNLETIPWRKSSFAENVFVKDLGVADGYALQLVKFEPNTSFPDHLHIKAEFIYILDGELMQNNVVLKKGFVSISQPGTHDENVKTISGCEFLLFSAT